MAAAGPLEDTLLAILQVAEGEWVLRFADRDVEASFVEAEQRLVFTVSIGKPPAGRELAVYKALLNYNFIWRDTGSVRMALDGLDEELVMLADLVGAGISAAAIAAVAVNMAGRAAVWAAILEAGAPAGEPASVRLASEATFRI